jgi:putative transposase
MPGTLGAGLASARHLEDASIFNNDSASGNNFILSPVGKIIEKQWNDIPNHYKGIELDAYVIMPNHVHGIIIINQKNKRADARPAPTLSDIICSFKSRSAVESLQYIKKTTPAASRKIWQRSCYDHIIRSERSLQAIREYILRNPINWEGTLIIC